MRRINFLRNASKLGMYSTLLAVAAAALLTGGCCKLLPWAMAVDPSLTGNSDANGMLEPGETVVVEPSWRNQPTGRTGEYYCRTVTESGSATSLQGPINGDYVIGDGAAWYGPIAANATKKPIEGYALFVSSPTGRPASHWDAALKEELTGTVSRAKEWKLHIGGSFSDVPRSHPFYRKIETLFHSGITSGCAPGAYCPGGTITRSQIAIFLAKGSAGGEAGLPESGTVATASYSCTDGGESIYADVLPTSSFCRHVHYLAAQNVMGGCGAFYFCPNDAVSRHEMAVLVASATVAPAGSPGIPLTYGPDASTGLSYSCDETNPNVHFFDVPASVPYCKHAHYLWARGIVAGCGPAQYCLGGKVTRDQMAKFLVNAFGLRLYGP